MMEKESTNIQLDAIRKYAGRYQFEQMPDLSFSVLWKNGLLYGNMPIFCGDLIIHLEMEDKFFVCEKGWQIEFILEDGKSFWEV